MTLSEFFKKHDVKRDYFAEKLGVSRMMLHHYTKGTSEPSLRMAFKIEEITYGLVPAKTLLKEDKKKRKSV